MVVAVLRTIFFLLTVVPVGFSTTFGPSCSTELAGEGNFPTRLERAYRALLTGAGAGVVDGDDLRALLQPGKLFALPDRGPSTREPIRQALESLGVAVAALGAEQPLVEGRLRNVLEELLRATNQGDGRRETVRRDTGKVEIFRALKGPVRTVRGGTFSPDGSIFLSVESDSILRSWDVTTTRYHRPPLILNPSVAPRDLVFAKDGTILMADGDHFLHLADWGKQVLETVSFEPHLNQREDTDFHAVRSAISPDGSWIAVGTKEGAVALYNVERGRVARWFFAKLATRGSRSRASFLRRYATANPIRSESITRLRFSPDSRRLLIGCPEYGDYVWAVAGVGKPVRLEKSMGVSEPFYFSPDGKRLHSSLGTWDSITGKLLWDVPGDPEPMHAALSPDGRFLVLADKEELRVFDAKRGSRSGEIPLGRRFPSVSGMVFSPDGTRLAVFGSTGSSGILIVDFPAWVEEVRP